MTILFLLLNLVSNSEEENRTRVLENGVLRGTFKTERGEAFH
jgi:hypothetical protein